MRTEHLFDFISIRMVLPQCWDMLHIANNKDVQNNVLTAAQNRCIKSMPKMAHQKNSFSKLVFIQGYSIRLVVSAAIIAVATLIFGSSKVAPNTHLFTFALRNQEMWQTWPWAQKFRMTRCELHIACNNFRTLEIDSFFQVAERKGALQRLVPTCCQPSKFALTSAEAMTS